MNRLLTVMYRGPLTSCNYACGYCPFAKWTESAARLQKDRDSLAAFVSWLRSQSQFRWNILFTPWGEALVRRWYRQAMCELSHCEHVSIVSAQTNLSCGLDWLAECCPDRTALWATFHPTECELDRFVQKVRRIHELSIQISVGAVGVVEHLPVLEELRQQLPPEVEVWINAQQPRSRPYRPDEVARFIQLDEQFPLTLKRHRSYGLPCRTGETTFTVDGQGHIRRCHFVDEILGTIHSADWSNALRSRTCPRRFCGCYLGISQLHSPTVEPFLVARVPGLLDRSRAAED